MKVADFWKIYKANNCKAMQTASFSMCDSPLTGDHGYFEVAIYEKQGGIWCLESTIEHFNEVRHREFASEDECLRSFLSMYDYYLRGVGFPVDKFKLNI